MKTEQDPDRPLYNSRIILPYINLLLKSGFSQVDIKNLLTYAQMQSHEVDDQGHWFSQNQIDRFYERVVQLTGNPKIAREAGRQAASPGTIGTMRQYFLALVGPAKAFSLISKAANNFTHSAIYEPIRINSNTVEVTVTPNAGAAEKPFQCESRKGFFEALLMMLNHRAPDISHPECLFKSGAVCRYIISWQEDSATRWQIYRNILIAILLFGNLALLPFNPQLVLHYLVPSTIVLTLLVSLIAALLEKKALRSSLEEFWDASESLIGQIDTTHRSTQLVSEIGQIISSKIKGSNILEAIVHILQERLDFDRVAIITANAERTRLQLRVGSGYTEEQKRLFEATEFHLDRPESTGAFVVAFHEQKPLLINDVNVIEGTLSLRSLALMKKLETRAFICCPIVYNGESIGLLAVDNQNTKRPLIQNDINLLMGITPVIGISITNAEFPQAHAQAPPEYSCDL